MRGQGPGPLRVKILSTFSSFCARPRLRKINKAHPQQVRTSLLASFHTCSLALIAQYNFPIILIVDVFKLLPEQTETNYY